MGSGRSGAGVGPTERSHCGSSPSERRLAQASIYGVAAARWSILAGALVRLGRLLIPNPKGGTLVFVRPEVKRTAFAEEPGTTLVAGGASPGKAYEAQGQGGELWMPLHHLYESGEYAEAADRGRELIEAHPEYAGPLCNLACCESLPGRTDDAIRHLRLAIDRHEPFRSLAAGDSDFDPIRDEAAFKELVQGNAAKTMG